MSLIRWVLLVGVVCSCIYRVRNNTTASTQGTWICKAFPDGTFFQSDLLNCLGSCSRPVPSKQVCASHCNESAQFVLLDAAACSKCGSFIRLSTSSQSNCHFACPPENPYIEHDLHSYQCVQVCNPTYSFDTPLYEYDGECTKDCPDERFFETRKKCLRKCPKEAPLSVHVTEGAGIRRYCINGRSCPTGFMKGTQVNCTDKCPNGQYAVNNTICVKHCPFNMKYTLGVDCIARCPPLSILTSELSTEYLCDYRLGKVLVIIGLLAALQTTLWLICCVQCARRDVRPTRQKQILEALASYEM